MSPPSKDLEEHALSTPNSPQESKSKPTAIILAGKVFHILVFAFSITSFFHTISEHDTSIWTYMDLIHLAMEGENMLRLIPRTFQILLVLLHQLISRNVVNRTH